MIVTIPKAEKWFQKALAAGSPSASYLLGQFQKNHYGNITEAEKFWNIAAKGGNLAAKDELKNLADERDKLAREHEQQVKAQKAELARQAKEQKVEAARQAKEQQQIASFRKSLKEGDDTNCGPVIEAKGKLIKISFAVANYGNEHWIKREQAFPVSYGCRFFNGEYQPPQ